jgi:O-methyltransferase
MYEDPNTGLIYSPWNLDEYFNQTYQKIQHNTLVDKYRCYELWKLVEQSAKLSEGSIIEIGVWRGGTGALIAEQANRCNIKEDVFLCDTFFGCVKAGPNDSAYLGGEHSDTSEQIVKDLLNQLNINNASILTGIFPEDSGNIVKDKKFRFCHIDVDIYESAKNIVDWIWDKMVPGGIFVYDDYGFMGCDGITKYVNEQIDLKDRMVIYNLNGHAIVIKI